MRRLRSIAVYLALVALVTRALVPVGWMPVAQAASPTTLMPCPMMDGIRGMAVPLQKAKPQPPAKHQLPASHEGSICAFATAAQPVRALEPYQIEVASPLLRPLFSRAVIFRPPAGITSPALRRTSPDPTNNRQHPGVRTLSGSARSHHLWR